MKKIIHIDMDAFYASVEQRDDPSLRGRPIVVGGTPERRGVVACASYEARGFGVRSAMSCSQALRLCPKVQFVEPHFDQYLKVSQEIHTLFKQVTSVMEPLSLDEAYLDVTSNHWNEPLATKIALWIKNEIQTQLGLSASAGIAPNKFIAKLASAHQKPNGFVVVPPEKVFPFIEYLPVEKFWGVGPVTAQKLKDHGIYTAADLRQQKVCNLEKIVGKAASFIFALAFGNDDRLVTPESLAQSRGTELTFAQDIRNVETLSQVLQNQAQELSMALKSERCLAKTLCLKIKYSDFLVVTKSRTWVNPTHDGNRIFRVAHDLLHETEAARRPVRLIGLVMRQFIYETDPLQFWFPFDEDLKSKRRK